MKLETSDLVGFIKERHRNQVRGIKQSPALAIVVMGDEAPSASFIRAKQRYGEDIGIDVRVLRPESSAQLSQTLSELGKDETVGGIVLQLPLPSEHDTVTAINQLNPGKDVDGLGDNSSFEPATAKAIMWILASVSTNLKDAKVAVVGQGRLVGAPVSALMEASGIKVLRCDIDTKDLMDITKEADVIVSGTGHSGSITREMLKDGAIVIDAGTTEAAGKLAGDVDPKLYDDPKIKVTPVPGGVGPMTVAALFDNFLIAASRK